MSCGSHASVDEAAGEAQPRNAGVVTVQASCTEKQHSRTAVRQCTPAEHTAVGQSRSTQDCPKPRHRRHTRPANTAALRRKVHPMPSAAATAEQALRQRTSDHAAVTAPTSTKMTRHSLFHSLGTGSPIGKAQIARIHRSRKPVWAFPSFGGSNPPSPLLSSRSVCKSAPYICWTAATGRSVRGP